MPSQKLKGGMIYRCNVCCCQLYDDEGKCYCQDCRGVLEALGRRSVECVPKEISPEIQAVLDARVAAHRDRVQQEMMLHGLTTGVRD